MATDAGHDFLSARQIFADALSLSRQHTDVEPIKASASTVQGSESERKLALDQAFRDGIKDLVINSSGCPDYISIINLSIDAVRLGLCSPTTPFLLLSDVFDAVTIRESDEVFKFVEDKVGTWKATEFYTAGKNYLLRMCNDLLRRLSKSQDTVFCGRIQLFLARFFPLDEKSGLNLMSQFHLDNVTKYNTDQKEGSLKNEERDPSSMDFEEGETGTNATPIDYTLYRKFWAVQDFFRNPTQSFVKEKWRLFLRNTKAVLEAFTSLKLDDVSASKNKGPSTGEDTHTFFAKFLTSEKLYDLQLSDPTFRRYILVQYLILFQYLNQPVKFKQPQHQTTDEMATFVKETQEKVYTLLKETPPNGNEFCKDIQHCLSREEHWNAWKNEGCPSYVREKTSAEPNPPKTINSRKRSLGEDMEIESQASKKKIDMGNHELTRLWNICHDNMDACRAPERLFQPNMEAFFAVAKEEADPEACIEDEYKSVNNSNYAWKALRLMARRSPYFFQTVTNTGPPIKTIPAYLELMVTKLTKEISQTSTTTEELKTEEENVENDELLKGGEESLEKVMILQTEQLDAIVPKLGADWKTLSSELGFTEEEVASIEDEQSEIKEQGRSMLLKWKEREGDQATQETLAKALQESGLKDIVESVLEATNGS